jgi:DNA-binding SARP family transcriptional activator
VAVLGELIVLHDGRPAALRRKSRALLAYLAVTGCLHQRSWLAALFCQGAGDPAAALRLLLSRIRGQLGAGVLRTPGQQVGLNLEVCWVDLPRFEAHAGPGPTRGTPEQLAAAVALHRGTLLDGLHLDGAPEFDLWLLGERVHLSQRYAQTLDRLIVAEDARGGADAALGYARALVQANPLLEEAHMRLMRLYAGTGQREAALVQYERCRDLLWRELSVEPGQELRALRDSIGARPQPPIAHAAAQRSPALLERASELARLAALWAGLGAGRSAVALIEGQAGAGKSRLLREFVRTLPGSCLRLGACPEPAQDQPYAAWTELLEMQLTPAELARLPALWRDELLRLLPGHAAQLGLDLPLPPPTAGVEIERIFAVVAETLVSRDSGPLLIAIEDLHRADAASLRLLGYLARRLANRPVMLVGTLRTYEARQLPALLALLDDLERLGAARLALAPLSDQAVAELTARLWGGLPAPQHPTAAARVAHVTGGNPLLVVELLRELAALGSMPEALPIPRGLRELTERRLADMPAGVRQVIEILAILAEPATLHEICALSACPPDEVATALDLGQQCGLLADDAGAPIARYRFSHELPREAVMAQLSAARRQSLRRWIASYLCMDTPVDTPPGYTRRIASRDCGLPMRSLDR